MQVVDKLKKTKALSTLCATVMVVVVIYWPEITITINEVSFVFNT